MFSAGDQWVKEDKPRQNEFGSDNFDIFSLKLLTNGEEYYKIERLVRKKYIYAPLAQLDRAFGYGPEGWGFELSMARQKRLKSMEFDRFFVFSVLGALFVYLTIVLIKFRKIYLFYVFL